MEVGPRDGLQNEKSPLKLDTKLELLKRLSRTGLRNIEAGSFVAPKWVPQVGLKRIPVEGSGSSHTDLSAC